MAEQDDMMKRMSEAFNKYMEDILIGGIDMGGDDRTVYTTMNSQPSEPLTIEHLEKAMELLRAKVPPNPYQQYLETHEWRFPACHQRELLEALQPPADSLFHSPLVDKFYGIPIVWDNKLTDRCELRPSPERIARYLKRLEAEAEMNVANNRFLADELTQREFSVEVGQIWERFMLETRTDDDQRTPGGEA